MLDKSIEEYKDICVQVREASAAIMNYTTASIALSGGAAVAFVRYDSFVDVKNGVAAVIIISLSIVTTLILLLIYYKCDSHNRLAAYRGIISSEMIDDPIENSESQIRVSGAGEGEANRAYTLQDGISLASFAMCMAHLNRVYKEGRFELRFYKDPEFNKAKGVLKGMTSNEVEDHVAAAFPSRVKIVDYQRIENENPTERVIARLDENIGSPFFKDLIKELRELNFTLRNKDYRRCYSFLTTMLLRHLNEAKDRSTGHLKGIFGFSNRSGSWGFPLYVRNVLTFIIYAETIVSFIFFFKSIWSFYVDIYTLFYIGLLGCWLSYYTTSMRTFKQLTVGSRTTDAYFRQFLPFRLLYITTIYPKVRPYYIGTEWKKSLDVELRPSGSRATSIIEAPQ